MRRRRVDTDEFLGPPAGIITSDIEIRNKIPICRTDEDYLETMWGKIEWLKDLQEKYDCPIFDGGDLFDKDLKVKPNHLLLGRAIASLPTQFYTVPGNHDLPGKSLANYENSAMAVLERAGIVNTKTRSIPGDSPNKYKKFNKPRIVIHRFPWGVPLKRIDLIMNNDWEGEREYHVVLIHAMVYNGNPPFPGCKGYEAGEVLNIFDNMDLIVCGDNHKTFTRSKGNTILVNPGSLMRNDADQIDHKPCVFIWYPYGDFPRVRQVFVHIKKGVVSRVHIEEKQGIENRLSAFVEKLGTQELDGVDFEKNLEKSLTKDIHPSIIEKVWKYFER